MSDYDFIQLYKKLEVLDRELKELRAEVSQIKWYQQRGATVGAVAYSATTPKKQWVPQWEEDLSDNEQWDNDHK